MKRGKKRITTAFGKKIYLLGVDQDCKNVWLEAPQWNCRWYWGFGYIERYTNNRNPSKAKDILSHTHWDTEIVGKQEYYDTEKQCFRLRSDYIHHLNENPDFKVTTLSDKESWELADLMQSFYILSKTAGIYNKGGSHLSTSVISLKNAKLYDQINYVDLPNIFARIDQILTPELKKTGEISCNM